MDDTVNYSTNAKRQLGLSSGEVDPPDTSRGVERTRCSASIDWLAFTIKKKARSEALRLIVDMFGEMEQLYRKDGTSMGWRGYTHCARILSTGRIGWHPASPDMGVHVMLPSTAVAEWSRLGGDGFRLLRWVKDKGANVTRVDCALDDRLGVLKMERITRHFESSSFASRAHRQNIRCQYDLAGGRTWYVGSPSSERMVRIYDKKRERLAKGEAVKGHWLRVELQYRGRSADVLVDMILEGADVAGAVRSSVDFKTLDSGDSNSRRRQVAVWWLAFLEYATKLVVKVPEPERSLETVRSWFESQMAPTFAMLHAALGGGFIKDMVEQGEERWRPRHRALMEENTKLGWRLKELSTRGAQGT